jgi:molybdate transport system ATP-binding protein
MSARLSVAIRVPCERHDVELDWTTDEPALGVFGPSGAGKTTVLEALAGLRPEVRGRIEVDGRTWLDSERGVRLPPEQRGVGYVPQDLLLFPHLDVTANLRLGERRAPRAARRPARARVLEVLELGPLVGRAVGELSGGERQRVALARALCSAPDLLLLDEPLANLDRRLRQRILPYLVRVRREFGVPTIYVSHDPAEMALLAEEISVLEAGRCVVRGRAAAVFGGEALATGPGRESVVNVLEGTVREVGESLARVTVAPDLELAVADDGALAAGRRVALELGGAEILLACGATSGLSAQNVLAATVEEVHLAGEGERATAALVSCSVGRERRRISALVTGRAVHELGLAPGVAVRLIFKAQALTVLAIY